jgi:cytochrome P450 family 135
MRPVGGRAGGRVPPRPMSDRAARGLLPSGPSSGPLTQTVALHRDPAAMLRRARARHGDVFTIRLLTARPIVVVAAPDAVGPLAHADPGAARAGDARRQIVPFASTRSVFGADGHRHRAARAAIAGQFAPGAVAARRDAIAAIAAEHARMWPRRRPVRLLLRMRNLVDDVFVRMMLGVTDPPRAAQIVAALRWMLWTPGNPPVSLPGPEDGVVGPAAAAVYRARKAPLRRLLAEEIDARRRSATAEPDVLGAMARAEPDTPAAVLADDVIALLLAAQEPPSAGLTWLLDRLARAPELAEAFMDPRPSGDAARTPLQDAIVRETFRVRPPAIAMLRRLAEPRDVAGHRLPAGVVTMMPTPLLHRDPRAFPDPDAFRPERWTTGEAAEAAYLPFGSGSRRCLGETLAAAYVDCITPAVLGTVRLRPLLPAPERMVLRGTILVPHRSTPVLVQPRRP